MQRLEVVGELDEMELRAIVPELQSLTERYKRAEKIQQALYKISELSSSAIDLDNLYLEIHNVVRDFMTADNFYVAFHEKQDERIQFSYFVDERDEERVRSISYEKIKTGITAYILRSGDTLVMTQENVDTLAEKHGFEILGTPPVDLIGVPLKRDGNVIGAMVVQSYHDNVRYSEDDYEVLLFISQHIVTTVDRVKHRELTEQLIAQRTQQLSEANQGLEDEIRERKRMESLQKTLFEISELSANAELDIIKFYSSIHRILQRLINAPNCYIAIIDDEHQRVSFPYFVGKSDDTSQTRSLGKGLTEYVYGKGDACLINAETINSLLKAELLEESVARKMLRDGNSWMGAPLLLNNKVEGVIAVQTYGNSDDYDSDDLDILRFVSQHISVAIERRRSAEELKNYNRQLAKKVKERTAELDLSNQTLKQQIEQRKEIELKLIHDAHHDALTGLPNRVMFNNRLELAISSKGRHPQHNFAVLFIDLDRFKNINDTLGHHAGDEFLIEVAKRIDKCKRSHDLLARLGGDEFVILIDSYTNFRDVEAVAQRIVDSISQSFSIDGKEVYSGASVGITEITDTYTSADEALRDADAAMYQAKNLGRNRYVVFEINMRNQLVEEVALEAEFRKAFYQKSFECFIQPVLDIQNNDVLYFEATMRWQRKDGRYMQDAHFWDLADQCGLTYGVNQLLLDATFRQLHKWKLDPDHKHTKIGMTLSIEHLLHKKSLQNLVQLIECTEIDSHLLMIELSEQSLSKFSKYLPNVLDRLQALGISLVLDNFGSETASLSHLFKYDFDYIKLNANLVNTVSMSDKYHRLVQSIVMIADNADIKVIGDGVVDEACKLELTQLGCHYVQGEHVAPAKRV
ncbi:diguanylate cyclase domain-containing protein [Ningiella sp. W23]|uniref:sensor domain-containing phosphodiesterase n=1 Tax=Ningiella sp. W23 TaxID=3023715 RepID=UPI003756EB10